MNQEIKEKNKWWQYRKTGRKEAGKTALFGLLGFVICSLLLGESLIGDIFGLVFWIGGIIWLIKTIQIKIKKRKDTNKDIK